MLGLYYTPLALHTTVLRIYTKLIGDKRYGYVAMYYILI